jgi:hypothetical protein
MPTLTDRPRSRSPLRPALLPWLGALALAVAGCSGDDSPGPALKTTYIGLTPNAAEGAPPESLGSALLTARATGADLVYLSYVWTDLEPAPGQIDVSAVRSATAALRGLGFVAYLNLRVVDTNVNRLPPDLAGRPFDDGQVVARLDALVDSLLAVAAQYPLVALAIGNEVDIYFGLHPGEFPAFLATYQREVIRIHAALPGLAVGVSTTSPIQNFNAGLGDQLNAASDVVVYTYYPFQNGTDFAHRPPGTLEGDFTYMGLRAGGKPWALQEIGYSSSPLNGSSDSLQADFVRRFRAAAAGRSRSDLLFANWFLYTDMPAAVVDTLVGYYGFDTPGFRAYLGNLGLRASDGTPKSAWTAWRGGS